MGIALLSGVSYGMNLLIYILRALFHNALSTIPENELAMSMQIVFY